METILEFLRGLVVGIAFGALLCALLMVSVVCLVEWKRGNYDA